MDLTAGTLTRLRKPLSLPMKPKKSGCLPTDLSPFALNIGDDIVHGRHGNIELAGCKARHLCHRSRRWLHRDFEALPGEKTFVAGDEQRPVEAAGEDVDC